MPDNPALTPHAAEPPGGLTCDQARRQMERLVEEDDLKDVERVLLMEHVRGCAPCRGQLDSLRRLEARIKDAFAGLDTLPAPEGRSTSPWAKTERVPAVRGPSVSSVQRSAVRSMTRFLGAYAILAGVAAALLVSLGFVYMRYGRATDLAPSVKELGGTGWKTKGGDGKSLPLKAGEALLPSDRLTTGNSPLDLSLASGTQAVSRVALAPGSELRALSRSSYRLVKGAAYFDVRKDRPRSRLDETFDVDAGGLATVRVTGTTFGVDLTAAGPGGVLVFVEEGTVQVEAPMLPETARLAAGQEISVSQNGTSSLQASLGGRAPWLALLAPLAPKNPPPAVAQPGEGVAANAHLTARKELNWDAPVASVVLLDKNLAEGLAALGEALGKPPQLVELREQSQGPAVNTTATLTFSVHHRMPLQAVLRWMARDLSLRFEPPAAGRPPRFALAAANESPGSPSDGVLPEFARRALDAPVPEKIAGVTTVYALAEFLGARSALTMVVDDALAERYAANARKPGFALPGQTVAQKLDALLALLGAGVAWYDHVLYVAPVARIETLTMVTRHALPGRQLVGQPLNPLWARDLKDTLAAQCYPAEKAAVPASWLPALRLPGDAALAGKPALADVAWDLNQPEGPRLRYRAGVLGEAVACNVLTALRGESPPVPSAGGLISQTVPPGATVADIESLIEQARPFLRVQVAQGVKPQPFAKLAFVNKNLRLGEALECAAQLAGCGLRQENNDLWVVDTPAACYDRPAMQVLSLAPLAEQRPEMAPELARFFARWLVQFHPVTFGQAPDIRCVGNRIVFTGDRRQLQAAQRLRAALESAGPANAAEAQAWQPPARAAIAKNLAEPFAGGDAPLSGTFAGLLRRAALSAQLRCTVVVDPAAMREKADIAVNGLDVAKRTVGDVLLRLAEAAGLTVAIEGDVIWLRPKP
jgi:hypothetical protein